MVKFAHAIDAMKLKELSTSQSVRLQRSACLSSAAHVVDQSINQSVKQSINSNQSNRSIKQPITYVINQLSNQSIGKSATAHGSRAFAREGTWLRAAAALS
jgi:hypothetical protein